MFHIKTNLPNIQTKSKKCLKKTITKSKYNILQLHSLSKMLFKQFYNVYDNSTSCYTKVALGHTIHIIIAQNTTGTFF